MMTVAPLLDTFLNVIVFAFIGLLVWLYTAAPTRLDDD
jgi:hypothetical protein